MNARLETNVLRGWKPGWRTAIADNIATTSAIQTRRQRMRTRRAWKSLARIVFASVAIGVWIALHQQLT
jgi:hypothetical protein